MADPFLGYMRPIVLKEGGAKVTNDAADHGGLTKWGITEARARAAGFTRPMETMTLDEALEIYRVYFWRQPQFDLMAGVSEPLALFMLDIGINCGPAWPGRFLQRCLNVLNQQQRTWPDLSVDGQCGAMTRAAVATFKAARGADGEKVLLGMMRALASVRYIEIAEADPTQERFEFGWQRARAFDLEAA